MKRVNASNARLMRSLCEMSTKILIHKSDMLGFVPAIRVCGIFWQYPRPGGTDCVGVSGISGIIAGSQFYRIGGSTYVGAGIGAILYGAIIV